MGQDKVARADTRARSFESSAEKYIMSIEDVIGHDSVKESLLSAMFLAWSTDSRFIINSSLDALYLACKAVIRAASEQECSF